LDLKETAAVSQDGSFEDVIARLRAGDSAAAAAIFQRFAQRLIALARTRLDSRLRQKVDPEDVLQSVYKSFFLRHAQGQYDLESWDSLWSLLTLITVRKCYRWTAHFYTVGRDVRAEVPPNAAADESVCGWEPQAREPTPEQAAILAETVEEMLRELAPREREVVTLALQGYTAAEISGQLHRPGRTVYRILERVKKRLQRMQARDTKDSDS
jgi:RNA polymerase sigma-70 factor (ECF subfamily)